MREILPFVSLKILELVFLLNILTICTDRFSQEELDIGRNFEGNGLGLAISKKYIEKMGGSLIVDSIKGVGSTFTFTLPLAKVGKVDTA